MIRRPPRSTQGVSSAASDVYKRQELVEDKVTDVVVEPTESTVVKKIIGYAEPAAILLNHGDKAYVLVRFDKKSVEFFKSVIHKMENPFSRYLVAFYCYSMHYSNLLSKEDFDIFYAYMGLLQ
eukprot:TRINITY_DN13789_c0_g1_i3.p2 TRINITY_DN13789_c0_g1~~TRINITY_DN13789_c0_g1_i3.p2  ORF type:complete len:123 (+),score=24.59 TRINITY_DN13789_c0_g1_i3:143-511(+)